ncbi:RNA-binding S4 domain-containing protein [Bordetella sp. 2513F-2]
MQNIEFDLAPGASYIELNHLLKVAGICDSGGAGKAMVADGRVSVDGALETRKAAKIRGGQTVDCGNVRILVRQAPEA